MHDTLTCISEKVLYSRPEQDESYFDYMGATNSGLPFISSEGYQWETEG